MLKSLELYGFKSFADRTRFEFAPGITGVVGPNGSGKSNVVDALKWILGDQSAKSLRGHEMTDVIFNGSASRKPSPFAEAFLTIDNSQKFLAIDAAEVQIGRRIHRGGDAEYLINKAPARLKDIRELLMGTGAGNGAYSIIEQGRVDQILQANPTNRRLVFEEAAGVSRFKARRVEAERKLERVAQNLQRLSDIVDEVEAQLNATRGQAAKAVKYREIATELKRWWLGLAADDHRQLTSELAEVEPRLAAATQRLAELAEEQRSFESQNAVLERELHDLDERLRDAERRLSLHRENAASQNASLRFQTGRLQELDGDLSRLRAQRLTLVQRKRDAERELALHAARLEEFARDADRLRDRLHAQDEQLQRSAAETAQAAAALERARQGREAAAQDASLAEQRVATLEAQIENFEESLQRLCSRWEDAQVQQAEIEQRRGALRGDYERLIEESGTLQAELRLRQSRQQELAAARESLQEALAASREARSAALARKSLLEDLELRQEGLGIGVRELLHRARHADAPPWNSIVGNVADLLDVDLEYAGLIEVALGPRAQWIVLREYQPLLEYLAQGRVMLTGRIGFLALPERAAGAPLPPSRDGRRLIHLQTAASPAVDFDGRAGVVARADRLVQSEHGVQGLASAVLADTWIVHDLETALALAAEVGPAVRFVTLQGELLDSVGSIQLGTVRSETSLLSRKSELRRIKNDLLRFDRDVAQQEAELQAVLREGQEAESSALDCGAQAGALQQRLAEVLAALHAADQEAQHASREIEQLLSQQADAQAELNRLRNQLTAAEERLTAAQVAQAAAADAIAAAEAAHLAAVAQAQSLEQRKAAEQLDLVKQAERLATSREQLQRLEGEIQQRQAQLEEGERRLQAAQAQRAQLSLQLLNGRAALAEAYQAGDVLREEVRRWQAAKDELRLRRGQFVETEQRLRRERRELQERRHADEIRERDLRHSLATLAERLQDEYQLSLDEMVASGASALELYQTERGQGPRVPEADADAADEAPDDDGAPAHPFAGDAAEITFAEARPELEARVNRLRRKLRLLGHVNTDSLRDLEQLESRFQHLSGQLQDLLEAKATLEDIIKRINQESRRLFADTFQTIRGNFQKLFRKVFGGGEGDIVLEDPDDILECGIEITARPPGKELRSLSLLSGGEKTMTAIALIMSIFQAKPSPFCILDEVDAALDEANVDRFTAVVREFQQTTQFIMITHHKRSMLAADVLYGVTMEESGVSKRMSVRFEDISDSGEFRRAA